MDEGIPVLPKAHLPAMYKSMWPTVAGQHDMSVASGGIKLILNI